MYTIKGRYEGHMMNLNLMGVHENKALRFSAPEILFVCVPLVVLGVSLLTLFAPEIGFLAECQNIPGGDICTISLK